jgi:hypothetical protein
LQRDLKGWKVVKSIKTIFPTEMKERKYDNLIV